MSDLWSRSDATLPPFDERLKQLLDNAAAGIRASRTEIERAVTYLETARRLLAGGPTTVQPLTYALPSHLSSASSRWFVSSRSHRRASAAIPSRRHRSRWPPAPGARLPCTRTGCSGTMQYGHPVGYAQSVSTTDAERAGCAAIEPGTFVCRTHDWPQCQSPALSPARGGKTTGAAGNNPLEVLTSKTCTV